MAAGATIAARVERRDSRVVGERTAVLSRPPRSKRRITASVSS